MKYALYSFTAFVMNTIYVYTNDRASISSGGTLL